MPLPKELQDTIHEYCTNHLPGDIDWHTGQFLFVDDEELKNSLGRAFYSARYIYKLMEALSANGNEIHAFVKFQIVQYASIYEAVISYLLWKKYPNHPMVLELSTHNALKEVSALSNNVTSFKYSDPSLGTLDLKIAAWRESKTDKNSIPFKEKVDCAVNIGFVDINYGEEIKELYNLRNLAHLETEAAKKKDVEIEHSKLGYRRLKPFLEKIREEVSKVDDI